MTSSTKPCTHTNAFHLFFFRFFGWNQINSFFPFCRHGTFFFAGCAVQQFPSGRRNMASGACVYSCVRRLAINLLNFKIASLRDETRKTTRKKKVNAMQCDEMGCELSSFKPKPSLFYGLFYGLSSQMCHDFWK